MQCEIIFSSVKNHTNITFVSSWFSIFVEQKLGMQFKHPELLYALLLLLIPIIVHLFQLRRFKEVPFTNVAFLKEVSMQTRKSSQLKKWLTLATRLLLLACAVIAFAQPFTSKSDVFNKDKETVIYIDNSFSMQAKGSKGELLKRAVQDILTNFPEDEELTILTNTETYRNTTIKAIRNDLLQMSYSSNQLGYDAMQLKASKFFSKEENAIKNLIMVSDFQQKSKPLRIIEDSTYINRIVQLKPVNSDNVYVDSLFISGIDPNSLTLDVTVKNTGASIENLPISLFDGENLIAKTSTTLNSEGKVQFDLPVNKAIDGRVIINDNQLQFDNELYFSINSPEKIKVLTIKDSENDSFLKRVYSEDEFEYTSSELNRLNYSDIQAQNLIVLNELKSIPNSLITALHSYTENGGLIIIIPSNDLSLNSYNQLYTKYNLAKIGSLSPQEKRITTINYSHPLYDGVFDKQINNFQYPKVNKHFPINKNSGSAILEFEDGKPFLQNNENAYIFTASFSTENSNFKNSPLIVPTLYNIAKQSLKLPDLYYAIGRTNNFDVNTSLQKDNVLKLTKNSLQIIPQQQPFATKTKLTTNEEPSISGIYSIKNKDVELKRVSYNYNRMESSLIYNNLNPLDSKNIASSISQVINDLKSDSKINELWKWFVIFALIFLILEMLILKYIK